MEAMKLFRHTVTGSVGEYPDHYGDIFPHFEPVDADEPCLDCIPSPTPVEDEVSDTDYEIGYVTADEDLNDLDYIDSDWKETNE